MAENAEVQDLFNVDDIPSAKEFNETIWKEFKSLVDKFYQDKEYYEILKLNGKKIIIKIKHS